MKSKNYIKNNNINFIEEKIIIFQEIIQNTIISTNKYKILDILSNNDVNICIHDLEILFNKLNILSNKITLASDENISLNTDDMLNSLQEINNELSMIIQNFGTNNLNDLFLICLGSDFIQKNLENITNNDENNDFINKYTLLKKYFHPINYKTILWKNKDSNLHNSNNFNSKEYILKKNKIIEDCTIVEYAQTFDCFDLARTKLNFQIRVYGIKLCIQDKSKKQTLIISGVIDDIFLDCINNNFINSFIKKLEEEKPKLTIFQEISWNKFVESLTLKQIFIYNNLELYEKYTGYINQTNNIKRKTISQNVKDFSDGELFYQRTYLLQLLIRSSETDFQYLAYLLYDLLSSEQNANTDTQEQTLLFDSFPWPVKKYFKESMKQTIQYTNNRNFDDNKIPIEQQICLLKTNINVKEKAMQKLKEIKSKSDDSGSKARQYLDGLLKIPFGIYKEEAILNKVKLIKELFNEIIDIIKDIECINIEIKPNYNNLEIVSNLSLINNNLSEIDTYIKNYCYLYFTNSSNKIQIVNNCNLLNNFIKKYNINNFKFSTTNKNLHNIKNQIYNFFNQIIPTKELLEDIIKQNIPENHNIYKLSNINNDIQRIQSEQKLLSNYMKNITNILDKSVFGHTKAKRQVERIIAQWINGEKSGYCFGFEGPPGVGKTSLAKKGLANCLLDENQESRPYAFIAIGGSANGSTLEGHNYTYVGSTWGKIVDILIEKKCMNPIIFIDELDKVSRTEQGKEIIGILTHLIDSTQNDSFQDKYFNGIDFDLSKVLFIFSYNDPDLIDKILLDRIHRVKFNHLNIQEKLTITSQYILPEIFKRLGIENIISISDEVITFIINNYTLEPGVRKLKEILFEILGEINLSILKDNKYFNVPIQLTCDLVKEYLSERQEINKIKINSSSKVGVINGLWANALGQGGILHIEVKFFLSSNFLDLKLTGMQGDVMKESMSVAKTLALTLLNKNENKKCIDFFEKTKNQGIHIHVPEGATPKDGPSAGVAITMAIYSCLTNKIIKNNIAITGEVSLQGNITAIGGLDLKILGGINAGITCFIFPKQNKKDYDLFLEKYKNLIQLEDITFITVENIYEVMNYIFL